MVGEYLRRHNRDMIVSYCMPFCLLCVPLNRIPLCLAPYSTLHCFDVLVLRFFRFPRTGRGRGGFGGGVGGSGGGGFGPGQFSQPLGSTYSLQRPTSMPVDRSQDANFHNGHPM